MAYIDVTSGETISASATEGGYVAGNLIDDNPNTFWSNFDGGTTAWVKVQFGTSKIIEKYTIQAQATFYYDGSPSAWTFKGSNNNTDWDTLDTISGSTGWEAGEKREWTFSNSTAYTYYKWDFTATDGRVHYTTAEIEMMILVEDANAIFFGAAF